MITLMRYDPFFGEALTLRDAVNRLFEQSFVRPFWSWTTPLATIPMNVFETEHGYQVQVLLPGLKPEDIELTVQQNTLTIKGQFHPLVEEGKQVNWLVHEIGTGSFERSITFARPVEADKIDTHYEYGVLTISVPYSEVSRPKRISITAGQQAKELIGAGSR